MKVAYFAFSEKFPAPHAGYVHVNEMTKNIGRCGVNITAYVKSPQRSLLPDKKEKNRTIKYVKFPFLTKKDMLSDMLCLPSSYRKVRRDVKKYDLIHERLAPLNVWSISILRNIHAPYLLEVNSPLVEELGNGLLRSAAGRIRELQFKRCDGIITQTNTLRKIISNFTDKPIFVVPNGVDIRKFTPDKFSEEVRGKYALGDEVLITFTGAFKKWHGVHQIPEIAERLFAEHKNVKFLLVGEGPMYEEVKRMCGKFGNKVMLPGAVESERIPEILASSDILIAPFDTSGYKVLEDYGFWWCPVKLFEYMASGKPIVSYDFEEVKNIVKGAGLLAKAGNLEGFIECILQLVADKNLRKKLGKKGRKIAEKKYDWGERAKQTVRIYREVINEIFSISSIDRKNP